jgi:hypothetical protein
MADDTQPRQGDVEIVTMDVQAKLVKKSAKPSRTPRKPKPKTKPKRK